MLESLRLNKRRPITTGASHEEKQDITSTLLMMPLLRSQFCNWFKSASLVVAKSGLKMASAVRG